MKATFRFHDEETGCIIHEEEGDTGRLPLPGTVLLEVQPYALGGKTTARKILSCAHVEHGRGHEPFVLVRVGAPYDFDAEGGR